MPANLGASTECVKITDFMFTFANTRAAKASGRMKRKSLFPFLTLHDLPCLHNCSRRIEYLRLFEQLNIMRFWWWTFCVLTPTKKKHLNN
jgi:hypothetical protein